MKKNKNIPKFEDAELYSKWIDELYQNGNIVNYINMKKPQKCGKRYSLSSADQDFENVLIGIRINSRILKFVKEYSKLRGMQYQSILKDWIANGYLHSLANLQKLKDKK